MSQYFPKPYEPFGLIRRILYKMSQYFPKPYEPFEEEINVKVDLSNYATKS